MVSLNMEFDITHNILMGLFFSLKIILSLKIKSNLYARAKFYYPFWDNRGIPFQLFLDDRGTFKRSFSYGSHCYIRWPQEEEIPDEEEGAVRCMYPFQFEYATRFSLSFTLRVFFLFPRPLFLLLSLAFSPSSSPDSSVPLTFLHLLSHLFPRSFSLTHITAHCI